MRGANEIRVGIVVVLAVSLMIGGYFYLRGLGLGADLYYLRLNGVASVAAGNDVRLQGVKVGQVKEVTLDPNTQKPLLTLAIRRGKPPFQLMRDYHYAVQTSAIIGESYVDIRGVYKPSAPAYAPNDESQLIIGQAAPGIEAISDEATTLIRDFRTTLSKFNVTIDRVNKGILSYDNQMSLVRALNSVTRLTERAGQTFGPQGVKLSFGDPRAQRSLNETLANTALAAQQANLAARNIRSLTSSFNGIVGENRSQIRQILGNLNQMARNVSGLTQSLTFIVQQGGLKENTKATFTALRQAAENVKDTTAGFKSIATDTTTQQNLRDTLTSLRETTEALRDTAQSVKSLATDPATQNQVKGILASLNTTASTLQATTETLRDTTVGLKGSLTATADNLQDTTAGLKNVVGDAQVQADLKAIPAELRRTLEATTATAERVNALLGGRKTKPGATPTGQAAKKRAHTPGGLNFTFRRFTDFSGKPRVGEDIEGRNYGDLTFNTELLGGPFRLGLANIGEGSDLTLQTGTFIGQGAALRYGLYRSKLGAGAEYRRGRFSLEGNLWNPNDTSYNAYFGFQATRNLEILLGRESIRGTRTTAVGIRVRP
ncbi:MAG TPA: MlaD family protein [Abditibacteriaceae bacterium]|nr:MlaD family protein [Abditibacteriaceae bacterium]